MQATYRIANRGNLAIQTEIFSVPVSAAKAAIKILDCRPGSYWQNNLATPTRRAVRAKSETVKIYVAGFSTAAIANALASVGCETIFAGDI